MKNDKIDLELIMALSLEVADRFKLIMKLFPEEKDHLLKDLAASSLHLTFFIKNLVDNLHGVDFSLNKQYDLFLKECGCAERRVEK